MKPVEYLGEQLIQHYFPEVKLIHALEPGEYNSLAFESINRLIEDLERLRDIDKG